MNVYHKAEKPTFYFIGVTTGQSSIMRVFPKWAELLGLDAQIKGIDFQPHSPAEQYREAVEFLKMILCRLVHWSQHTSWIFIGLARINLTKLIPSQRCLAKSVLFQRKMESFALTQKIPSPVALRWSILSPGITGASTMEMCCSSAPAEAAWL